MMGVRFISSFILPKRFLFRCYGGGDFGVITSVVQVFVIFHVLGLYLKQKALCVGIEKLSFRTVLPLLR